VVEFRSAREQVYLLPYNKEEEGDWVSLLRIYWAPWQRSSRLKAIDKSVAM
jgi:hypothetical protein